MKNIHLIPTDKASMLFYYNNHLGLARNFVKKNDGVNPKHIYITSDEEIKVNDYITDGYKVWKWKDDSSLLGRKKVILTTDQNLIADGIQAIDDEFLEWFVKNPSCEWVEVRFDYKKFRWSDLNKSQCYKIIIPKEEPKPHSFCETPEEKCTMNYCDENGCQNRVRHLVEPQEELKQEIISTEEDAKIFVDTLENPPAPNEKLKTAFEKQLNQETLEEAAEKYGWRIKINTFSDKVKANELAESAQQDFIEGAKSDAARDYWFKIFKEQ